MSHRYNQHEIGQLSMKWDLHTDFVEAMIGKGIRDGEWHLVGPAIDSLQYGYRAMTRLVGQKPEYKWKFSTDDIGNFVWDSIRGSW